MGKTRRLYRGGQGRRGVRPPKPAAARPAQPARAVQRPQPQQQVTRRQTQTPEQKARAAEAKARGLEAQRKKAAESGQSLEQRQANIAIKKKKEKNDAAAARTRKKTEADQQAAAAKKQKKKEANAAKRKPQSSQRAPPSAASVSSPAISSGPGGPGFGANSGLPAAPAAAAPVAAAAAEDASSIGSANAPTSDGPYSAEEAAVADTVSASDYGLNPDGSIDCSNTPPGEKCPTEEQCKNQALYFIARSNAVANYRRSVLPPVKSFLETLKNGNINLAEHAQKNPDFFTSLGMVSDAQAQSTSNPRVFKGVGEVDAALAAAVKEAIGNSEECSKNAGAPAQAAGRLTRRRKYTHLRKTQRNKRRSRK